MSVQHLARHIFSLRVGHGTFLCNFVVLFVISALAAGYDWKTTFTLEIQLGLHAMISNLEISPFFLTRNC